MASQFLVRLSILFLSSMHLVFSQNPKCGSLITYRQHSLLLSEAPQCFRNGCSAGNTSSTATTISSPCPVDAPCNRLWDVIRKKVDGQDWCKACHRDIACRIGGWPILNMTDACNFSPGDWIFAGNGGCCSSGDEPFRISEWIETLCNGSEWRKPFTYYGGMAKEDWEEWIEPWNWTVRPQNSSRHNITTDAACNGSAFLLTLGIENIVKLGSVTFDVVLTIVFRTWVRSLFKKNFHWPKAIAGGLLEFVSMFLSSVGVAIVLANTLGYQDTPVGELILLINSRPSILGFLCAFGLVAIIYFEPGIEQRGRDDDNHYIMLYLANTAAGFAICESLQQIVGGVYLWRTANVGRKKQFFLAGHLSPFWRGSAALRMYRGGLIWTIFSPITILGFFILAILQVRRLYLSRDPHHYGWKTRSVRLMLKIYLKFMNIFYTYKWQHQDSKAQRRREKAQRQQEMAQQRQEVAEPSRSTERLHGADGTQTIEQQDMADAPRSTERLQGGEDDQAVEQKYITEQRQAITHQPLDVTQQHQDTAQQQDITQQQLNVTQQQPGIENMPPETPGLLARLFQRLFRLVMLAISRVLTSKPLNWLVTLPYIYVYRNDIQTQNIPAGPTGLEAITRQVRTRYALEPTMSLAEPVQDTMLWIRKFMTILMLGTWTISYLSQWLFWSGFVQSSGPRWCPPKNELTTSRIRTILAVLSFFGITLNFGTNLLPL